MTHKQSCMITAPRDLIDCLCLTTCRYMCIGMWVDNNCSEMTYWFELLISVYFSVKETDLTKKRELKTNKKKVHKHTLLENNACGFSFQACGVVKSYNWGYTVSLQESGCWYDRIIPTALEKACRALQRFGPSFLPTQEMQVTACMFPIRL